jgi:hypothetical protein
MIGAEIHDAGNYQVTIVESVVGVCSGQQGGFVIDDSSPVDGQSLESIAVRHGHSIGAAERVCNYNYTTTNLKAILKTNLPISIDMGQVFYYTPCLVPDSSEREARCRQSISWLERGARA